MRRDRSALLGEGGEPLPRHELLSLLLLLVLPAVAVNVEAVAAGDIM